MWCEAGKYFCRKRRSGRTDGWLGGGIRVRAAGVVVRWGERAEEPSSTLAPREGSGIRGGRLQEATARLGGSAAQRIASEPGSASSGTGQRYRRAGVRFRTKKGAVARARRDVDAASGSVFSRRKAQAG